MLCRYELHGQCLDDECSFQHLKPSVKQRDNCRSVKSSTTSENHVTSKMQEIQIDIEKFQKSYITIVLVELLNRMEPKLMQKYLNTTSDPPQPDGDCTRYFDTEPLLTTDSTVTKKLVAFALSLLNNKKPELDLTDIVEENMADGDNKPL